MRRRWSSRQRHKLKTIGLFPDYYPHRMDDYPFGCGFFIGTTMSKLPAIQFYPGDWRKDPGVQALSFHDRGVWFEILLLMHESDERGKLKLNGKPMPTEALGRLLGLDNQNLTSTITKLLEYGVASTCEESGSLICRRMVRDEELREVRKKCGKMGGNPNLVNQKTTKQVKQKQTTKVKQNATPSSSISSSITSVSISEADAKSEVVIPDKINTPEAIQAAEMWFAHLEVTSPDKVPMSGSPQEEAFWLDAARMGSDRFVRSVEHCVARGWINLRQFDETETKGKTSGTFKRGNKAADREAANADAFAVLYAAIGDQESHEAG